MPLMPLMPPLRRYRFPFDAAPLHIDAAAFAAAPSLRRCRFAAIVFSVSLPHAADFAIFRYYAAAFHAHYAPLSCFSPLGYASVAFFAVVITPYAAHYAMLPCCLR